MKISELQARQGNVEIIADVVEVGEARSFSKFGKDGKVANAIIKDGSGQIKLSLWNEQIDQVKAGAKVQIKNGYVSEWQGELQLTTGKFGSLSIVEGGASGASVAAQAKSPAAKPVKSAEGPVPTEESSETSEDFVVDEE